jgi:hypothetical protein
LNRPLELGERGPDLGMVRLQAPSLQQRLEGATGRRLEQKALRKSLPCLGQQTLLLGLCKGILGVNEAELEPDELFVAEAEALRFMRPRPCASDNKAPASAKRPSASATSAEVRTARPRSAASVWISGASASTSAARE